MATLNIKTPNVPINDDEYVNILNRMDWFCHQLGFQFLELHNQTTEIVNPDYPNAIYAQNLSICATVLMELPQPVYLGINKSKDKICFTGISVKFSKRQHSETGKVSYEMQVKLDGHTIKSGCRDKEIIEFPGITHQFAESISDFDYDSVIKTIKRMIDFKKISDSKFKELTERFADDLAAVTSVK